MVNFFLVGVPKAGTTSAYYYLRQHDDVYMPDVKEPSYFAFKDMTLESYSSGNHSVTDYETYCSLFSDAKDQQIKGEASTTYFYSKSAAKRIYQHNPKSKVVVILRDPVERAWSNYKMVRRSGYFGNVNKSYEDHFLDIVVSPVKSIKERRKREMRPLVPYIEGSKYHKKAATYYDIFGRENVKVINYHKYKNGNKKIMREVFSHIGVNPMQASINEPKRKMVGKQPVSETLVTVSSYLKELTGIEKVVPKWVLSIYRKKLFDKKELSSKIKSEMYHRYFKDDIRRTNNLCNINIKPTYT